MKAGSEVISGLSTLPDLGLIPPKFSEIRFRPAISEGEEELPLGWINGLAQAPHALLHVEIAAQVDRVRALHGTLGPVYRMAAVRIRTDEVKYLRGNV